MQPEPPVRLPTPPTKTNGDSSGASTTPVQASLSVAPQGGATATTARPSTATGVSPQKPLAPPPAVKPGQPTAPPPLVRPGQPLAPPPLVKPGQPTAPPPLVKLGQASATSSLVKPGQQASAPPPLVKPGQPLTSKDKILHQLHAIYPTFTKYVIMAARSVR